MTYHWIVSIKYTTVVICETGTAYPPVANPRILVVFVLLNL